MADTRVLPAEVAFKIHDLLKELSMEDKQSKLIGMTADEASTNLHYIISKVQLLKRKAAKADG